MRTSHDSRICGWVEPLTRGDNESDRAFHRRYMGSSAWREVREAYYSDPSNATRCACGSDDVDLHHATYARLGGMEAKGDLVPLCRFHHEAAHSLERLLRRHGVDREHALAEATVWVLTNLANDFTRQNVLGVWDQVCKALCRPRGSSEGVNTSGPMRAMTRIEVVGDWNQADVTVYIRDRFFSAFCVNEWKDSELELVALAIQAATGHGDLQVQVKTDQVQVVNA